MNITQLKLDNFCQFKEAILDLAHCNIIYGPNGAGKSTILEAVRVLLCADGDKPGVMRSDIRTGEKKYEIAYMAEDLTEVVRLQTMANNRLTIGGEHTSAEAYWKWLKGFGLNHMTKFMLNPMLFPSLPADEQRTILFPFLGIAFTHNVIMSKLPKFMGTFKPAAYSEIVKEFEARKGDDYFAKVEAAAIEERVIAKRDLKHLEAEKPEVVEIPNGIPMEKQKDVENLLSTLQHKRERLIGDRGENRGEKKGRIMAEIGMKKTAIDRMEADLKAENESAKNIKKTDVQAIETEIENLTKEIESFRSEAAKNGKPGEFSAEQLKKMADRIAVGSCGCYAMAKCDREIVLGFLRGEQERIKPNMALNEKIADRKMRIRAKRQKIGSAGSAEVREQHWAEVRKRIADGKEEVGALEKEAAGIAYIKEEEDTINDEIAAVEERISLGKKIVDAMKRFNEEAEKDQERKAEIKEVKQSIEMFDLIAKAFGADGIKASIMADGLGPFLEKVQEAMAALLPGFVVGYGGEGFTFRKDGAPYAFGRLSHTEQMRAGIALCHAVNAFVKIGILAVDEAQAFDYESRALVSGYIAEAISAGIYDTVFLILSVPAEGLEPHPLVNTDYAVFRVACESGVATIEKMVGEKVEI